MMRLSKVLAVVIREASLQHIFEKKYLNKNPFPLKYQALYMSKMQYFFQSLKHTWQLQLVSFIDKRKAKR